MGYPADRRGVPPGWQIKNIPGVKYKAAVGKPANGFAPNINVVDEVFPQSVEEYADANEKTLQKAMPGYKKLSRAPFTTSSNAKGVRLATEQTQNGRKLRTIFYLFATTNGPKLVVTCISLASDGTKYDSAFDKAMKSMTIK